jgi:hypothetical protein
VKPGTYPSLGWATALPANIRLNWKGLPRTNTSAYYENPQIKAVKSFIVQAPGAKEIDQSWSYVIAVAK